MPEANKPAITYHVKFSFNSQEELNNWMNAPNEVLGYALKMKIGKNIADEIEQGYKQVQSKPTTPTAPQAPRGKTNGNARSN